MADAAPGPVTSAALDRDLYCLYCGYNLRGLSGDPVRCPECGKLNPLDELEAPADIIAQQLRRMEAAPFWCVFAVVFGTPVQALFWALFVTAYSRRFFLRSEFLCVAFPAFGFVAIWIIGCYYFRKWCRAKPGWVAAFVMYHVWSLLQVLALTVPVFAILWFVLEGQDYFKGPHATMLRLTVFVASILFGAAVMYSSRWIHRLATDVFKPLQREMAVTIAREQMRKRMARQYRGLSG